ncbi:helix-turn-helix domain-containing protein [Micrococcus luteus]|uniref:helix-turn-helix domain-containing protein n=3 Tax=Micrococcus TaxID=1269 RepID=UPI0021054DDF|nr:helix-turn-helix domain-containing protein [Micrococcus luteus]UTX35249.1 helix-turn-helix domain-containing protein [Micrococcus luteus]
MSIEAMKWAQKVAETGQLNTGQAFVLLLLGDHADEAWSCHPSQELLARRSAQTVRSVERHIARLRDLGLVDTESRYGDGRGRIGLRYYLREEALSDLVQDPETRMNTRPDNLSGKSETRMNTRPDNLSGKSETRMNTRPDNLSGKSETRMNTRPDNLSGKSETRMNTRPDNLSGESTHPTISADSPDNRDFADYKDRARTNPQEPSSVRPSVRQSGAVRAETTTDDGRRTDQVIDGGEAVGLVHRGVVLADLVQRVPAAADLGDGQLRSIVDVILARASGPVRKPTAFVARSLASEFEELVAVTRPRPVAVAHAPAASGQVRELRTGEPCQDPDVHVPAYGQAVLADCPHCRLERRAMPRALMEAVD